MNDPRTRTAPDASFDPRAALQAASQHHQAGRLAQAEALYRRILDVAPSDANALHLLGVLAHQVGDRTSALRLIRDAVRIAPGSAVFQCNLGVVLLADGKPQEAQACFERAIARQPNYAEAHNNLATAQLQQHDVAAAERSARRALALRQPNAEAHYNLALALQRKGATTESIAEYRKAIAIRPGYADAHNDLGTVLHAQGAVDEAMDHYHLALEANAAHANAHNNIGTVLRERGDVDAAAACFDAALSTAPTLDVAHFNRASILLERCDLDGAIAALKQADALAPSGRNRMALATALPPLQATAADIVASRERIERELKRLVQHPLPVDDPLQRGLTPNTLLAYHGLDDRPLQELTARAHLAACPSLAWTAPHLENARDRDGGRVRVGFLSRYFFNHTVGEVMRGVLERLDARRFEVVVLRLGDEADAMAASIDASAARVVKLPRTLQAAREAVAAQRLDVLVYAEIGMDPATYFLAFSRLAPVQCVMWGHPDTTGIPNIDYYLSADDVEPAKADAHYAEVLVRPPHVLTWYRRPAPLPVVPAREAYGVPSSGALYVCPQALPKLHPDFDTLLGAILDRDRDGTLVLFDGRYAGWRNVMEARFARTLPGDAARRVLFLPRMALTRYFGLLTHASAMLDTRPFGGGNTAYQAFAFGVPIVTWPGTFARGRVTAALYRRMGMTELVADSADGYVERAHRLGVDPAFRAAMRASIVERSPVLYEDDDAVRHLEAFLENARPVSGARVPAGSSPATAAD